MTEFLFNEFDPVSAKEWKQKIQYDLKGADYNETLLWESSEGIHVKPFYHKEDSETSFRAIPGQPDRWTIVQDVFIDDEKTANHLALDALSRGAEAILFRADKPFDIPAVFENYPFERPMYFEFGFLSDTFLTGLIAYLNEKKAEVRYQTDIIGNFARSGNWFFDQQKDFEILENLVSATENIICIDASLYQNAGANIVQQLAYALAHANEYLNYFDGKTSVSLAFKFAVGTNYFFEIAKIRAFRLAFEALAKAYNVEATCHIMTIPTKRNKTLYDYNVNLLRTTTETMSAVLGGANAVCNLDYDSLYHKNNEFGSRISRNQLLILKEESYFEVVKNPVDGTYYVESLTEKLAQKALEVFKEIEKGNGFLHQLTEGVIQRKIKEAADAEQALFDSGELKLLGTNYHQNSNDRMKHDLELYPFVKKKNRKTLIEPIIEKRLAEKIEQERLETEA